MSINDYYEVNFNYNEDIKEDSIEYHRRLENKLKFERLAPLAVQGKIYDNHKYLLCTPYKGIIPVIYLGTYSKGVGSKEVQVKDLATGKSRYLETAEYLSRWILLYHDTPIDLL